MQLKDDDMCLAVTKYVLGCSNDPLDIRCLVREQKYQMSGHRLDNWTLSFDVSAATTISSGYCALSLQGLKIEAHEYGGSSLATGV